MFPPIFPTLGKYRLNIYLLDDWAKMIRSSERAKKLNKIYEERDHLNLRVKNKIV